MKMISSLLSFIVNVFVFIIKAIGLIYHLASVTSLGVLLIIGLIIFVLSRYFRLKQPNLSENIVDAIGGNQHIARQCSTGPQINRCSSNEPIEWWPIANRAACLDNLENSRSAIQKVSHQFVSMNK